MTMLKGRIGKSTTAPLWFAECEAIGAFTQGNDREDAAAQLAECIEAIVITNGGPKSFRAIVTETGEETDDAIVVYVDSQEPALLAANVLRHQRELSKLTQAEAAKRAGGKYQSEYAAYERGERDPSTAKLRELLGAVAPRLGVVIDTVRPEPKKASKR